MFGGKIYGRWRKGKSYGEHGEKIVRNLLEMIGWGNALNGVTVKCMFPGNQGGQFTSHQYIDFVKENSIRQSMDGKSCWADNIMIDCWFRSFKYEEVYLTQYNNIKEARTAIGQYVHIYNFERRHSALDYQTPAECYYPEMLMPYVA